MYKLQIHKSNRQIYAHPLALTNPNPKVPPVPGKSTSEGLSFSPDSSDWS